MDNEIENTTVTGAGKPDTFKSQFRECEYSGCTAELKTSAFVFETKLFCCPECIGFYLIDADRATEL